MDVIGKIRSKALSFFYSMVCMTFSSLYNEFGVHEPLPMRTLLSLTETCNQLQRRQHPNYVAEYPLRYYWPFLTEPLSEQH